MQSPWFSAEPVAYLTAVLLIDKNKIVSPSLFMHSSKKLLFWPPTWLHALSRDGKNQQYASLSNFFGYLKLLSMIVH